ncbi:MAG: tyrosine-type recombinase/integrase [Blastocatellia bacterium]
MAIRKRGAVWHLDVKIDGIRYRRACPEARNQKQALLAEANLRQEIFEGKYGKQKNSPRFSDYVDQTYLPWSKANKKSWKSDVWRVEVLKKHFKKKCLDEISPADVEKFKTSRRNGMTVRGGQRSKASVQRELELLSGIFTMAVVNNLIESNPVRKVRKFKLDNQRVRYLTAEEERQLMQGLIGKRAYLRPIIVLALNTGMRRGEILSLEWWQVDFNRNNLIVTKTKTDKTRFLPMNQAVRDELLELKANAEDKSRFVFESPKKPGVPIGEIKKAFNAVLKDAGIEDFHFHDFRHTAATRLAEAGADAYLIAEILGHSNVQMSFRYTHMTSERKRLALDSLHGYGANSGHK